MPGEDLFLLRKMSGRIKFITHSKKIVATGLMVVQITSLSSIGLQSDILRLPFYRPFKPFVV